MKSSRVILQMKRTNLEREYPTGLKVGCDGYDFIPLKQGCQK